VARRILGGRLKGLLLYGSYARSPLRARDMDILVVIDRLGSVREGLELEARIAAELHRSGIPADVVVLDVEGARENTAPGALLSGLVAGYRVLYDDGVCFDCLAAEAASRLAETDYEYWKGGRRWRLSAIARVSLERLHREQEA